MTKKEFRQKWDKMLKCKDARAYKMIHELIPQLFNLYNPKKVKK